MARRVESLTEYVSSRCPAVFFTSDIIALKASSEPVSRGCLGDSEILDDGELRWMNSQFREEFAAPIRDALTKATEEYRKLLEEYRAARQHDDTRKERYEDFVQEFIEENLKPRIGNGMLGDVMQEPVFDYLDEDFDVKFYLQSIDERNEAIETAAKEMARKGFFYRAKDKF